jgi:hypothetical protein
MQFGHSGSGSAALIFRLLFCRLPLRVLFEPDQPGFAAGQRAADDSRVRVAYRGARNGCSGVSCRGEHEFRSGRRPSFSPPKAPPYPKKTSLLQYRCPASNPETPNPSASFPGYALSEDLPRCEATTAPGKDGGARCGSRHPSGTGGSGDGHALAVGRPVMPHEPSSQRRLFHLPRHESDTVCRSEWSP